VGRAEPRRSRGRGVAYGMLAVALVATSSGRGLFAVTSAAAPPTVAIPTVFDPALSDPQAIAVADLVMEALGGRRAWDGTRYVHFAFEVERGGKRVAYRTHLWDRHAGRLRYEPTPATDGAKIVVLLDVQTRRGEAYRAGTRLPDAGTKPLLDEAYEAWINDSYWLLMPYKMKDPGVHLKYGGAEERAGAIYDIIELSFDKVGLTPGDRYWAQVNRATHLVDRWSYILQDDPPGSRPTVWDWVGWTRRGAILLAPRKISVRKEGTVTIGHPIMDVYEALPDEYFRSPAPLPEPLVGGGGTGGLK